MKLIRLVFLSILITSPVLSYASQDESRKVSSAIYKKLVENYELGKPKYISLATKDDLDSLSEGVIPETLKIGKVSSVKALEKSAAMQSSSYPSPPGVEPHTWVYVGVNVQTDFNEYIEQVAGSDRKIDHTTQFAILEVSPWFTNTSSANVAIEMKGTREVFDLTWHRAANDGSPSYRIDARNAAVQQVYADQPITNSSGLWLTIHTNEFGYNYIELKQYGVIKYAALSTFTYSNWNNYSNGMKVSLGQVYYCACGSIGVPNHTSFSFSGDLGWFDEP